MSYITKDTYKRKSKTCCICGCILTSGVCLSCDHRECEECGPYIPKLSYQELESALSTEAEKVRKLREALQNIADYPATQEGQDDWEEIEKGWELLADAARIALKEAGIEMGLNEDLSDRENVGSAALSVQRTREVRERLLAAKDAEIAALKQEVEEKKYLMELAERQFRLDQAELTTLRAKLEAMGRPVTDEEWVFHGGVNFSAGHKRALSAILASRASQPNPSEQS